LVDKVLADGGTLAARVAGSASDPLSTFSFDVRQRWPVERDLLLASTPVRDDRDRFIGRLYTLRDVTRERELERMKDEFVALASHELRTPLTSIKGYADLLLDGEVGPLSEEQLEFIGVVKANADRLVVLATDLLDLSRIETGGLVVSRRPCDLAAAVQVAASLLRPQLLAKEQTLTLDLPVGLPAVAGDRDRLEQIVTNLLSNAHKYTPAGGSITVQLFSDGARVCLAVQDTGIGMTEDEQGQLFTRFYRVNNPATRSVQGTGLGLAITRALVELHGGEITVESAPGAGTTFTVSLPAIDSPAAMDVPA
jgi:signal transduction histidine kinase